MKKLFLFCILSISPTANAVIINFDDIGYSGGYADVGTTHGFTFSSNMDWVDLSISSPHSSHGPAHSGNFAALNNNYGTGVVTGSSSSLFSLDGFYTKSFGSSTIGQTGTIFGYNSGSIVSSFSFTQTADWQYISLSMSGLDQVNFALGDNFWLDDVAFNESNGGTITISEPSRLILLGLGLIGLRLVRRNQNS